MKLKVIITGTTGMVGEGVLQECILNPDVEKILLINRRPGGYSDSKITEIIHKDFFDISQIENQLSGYNACFFCLGVSSVGMKEPEYYSLTYTLTMGIAQKLANLNPEMTFCYVSGAGTDGSEKGNSMWARVKGKTENDLMKLPFKRAYAFRPGFMKPTKGARNVNKYYVLVGWLYPVLRVVMPRFVSTIREVALAMISCAKDGYEKQVIEVPDIIRLSER
jgi:nucleoside-diphosphate-sugar epimerase